MQDVETTVESIMVKEVHSVTSETKVSEVAHLMLEKHARCIIIVGSDGALQGIVTDSDIAFRCAGRAHTFDLPISEIMTADPISVGPSADIYDVVRIMGERGFRRLPVVEGDKVVGIVSVRDVVRHLLHDLEITHQSS